MKKSAIVIDNFYDNPDSIREHGIAACDYAGGFSNYWYSHPGKRLISTELLSVFEKLLQIKIDKDHWHTYDAPDGEWNGCFQLKKKISDTICIHDHVGPTDAVYFSDGAYTNDCTKDGWAAVVFLTPNDISNKNCGIATYYNIDGITAVNKFDDSDLKESLSYNDCIKMVNYNSSEIPHPMISNDGKWRLLSKIQYKYNRAVIFHSSVFHDGMAGFGDSHESGRLIQTFFIKEQNNTEKKQ